MLAPRVSVVIPTRNRAHCLGEAIASIRTQTFADWELIVVDDGSQDDTGALVRRYCAQDSRIRYVRQPHGGCARASNTGLRLARGAYLFKLDDDDIALPDLLATCAAGLDAHPAHWAVNFRHRIYGRDDGSDGASADNRFGPLRFFRLSALRALEGWNEFYILSEDAELFIRGRIQRDWPVLPCRRPLYDYRISRTDNAGDRVSALENFCYRFLLERTRLMAHWGVFWRMPASHILPHAVAVLAAAHRRQGLLPSARFAHWQAHVWKDVRLGRLPRNVRAPVGALVRNMRRFPWAPLWEAKRVLWRRLQLVRAPLMQRARAMWGFVRIYYASREANARWRKRVKRRWRI